MIKYPLYFHAKSQSTSGIQSSWQTQVQHLDFSLTAAIPHEFEGPDGGFSPEDFFLLAATNCFIATFKVFAEKSKLEFHNLDIQSTLVMDRNEKGIPWMSKVVLKINLQMPEATDQAKRLLQKTSQSCFVLNSLLTSKEFEFSINNERILI